MGPTTVNVVDIGIFDPSGHALGDARGFRGWSGGARRSFRISRSHATPGYLAGPIAPGRWAVALGPYQIAGAGTPWTVRVTLHFGPKGPRFEPRPAPTAVPGRGPGWYRGDLHVHTVHSDGRQTQAQVLADARAAGLDFIGSSEHNTSSAQRTWGRHVPDDFLVIAGEEVTTRAGHWLATGVEPGTWIDWRYRPEDGQLARFADRARAAGGLAIAAHPYQLGSGIGWQFGDDFAEMDAVEVWNGPWSGLNQTANERAVQRWHRLLTDGVLKPAVGNSDSHDHDQQIGLAQTIVRAGALSVPELLAGYRGGHSWLAESARVGLELTAALGEVTYGCGDRVPSGAGRRGRRTPARHRPRRRLRGHAARPRRRPSPGDGDRDRRRGPHRHDRAGRDRVRPRRGAPRPGRGRTDGGDDEPGPPRRLGVAPAPEAAPLAQGLRGARVAHAPGAGWHADRRGPSPAPAEEAAQAQAEAAGPAAAAGEQAAASVR